MLSRTWYQATVIHRNPNPTMSSASNVHIVEIVEAAEAVKNVP